MKRSGSLLLMELTVMLLVFSLAAAICVQAFVWADNSSRQSANEDMALLQAQNAAEVLKHCGGDLEQAAKIHGGNSNGIWTVFYNEKWEIADGADVYSLRVEPVTTAQEFLGQAKLTVSDRDGAVLAEISVCWQEVTP